MAIDSTVGGSASNSYVSISEANSYFASHSFAASWAALTDTQKENVLVRSAIILDSLRFFGYKVSSLQKREWPRVCSFALSSEIPDNVKFAQMEQAIQEYSKISSTIKDETQSKVESVRLGNYSEKYSSTSGSYESSPLGQICTRAKSFLKGYYSISSRMLTRRELSQSGRYVINRGYEGEEFCEC